MGEENPDMPEKLDNETEEQEFDFDAWANGVGLNRATTAKLKKEDLCTERTLTLLNTADIRELGLAIGQRKLLETAVQQLASPQQQESRGQQQITASGKTCPLLRLRVVCCIQTRPRPTCQAHASPSTTYDARLTTVSNSLGQVRHLI